MWLFTIVCGKYFMMATPLGVYRLFSVGCLVVKSFIIVAQAALHTHGIILGLSSPFVVGKDQKTNVRGSKKPMQKQTSFIQCLCTRFYHLFTRKLY